MLESRAFAGVDYALVTSAYPSSWRLSAPQVRARVGHYLTAGLRGVVVHYRPDHEGAPTVTQDAACTVVTLAPSELPAALREVQTLGLPVLAHAPTAAALPHLHELAPRLGVWMLELLAIDYRRLAVDFSTPELNARRGTLDAGNAALRQALTPVFTDDSVPVVFASEHQRRHAEHDVGTSAGNAHVIGHHVAPGSPLVRVRTPDAVSSILVMTTSDALHAGSDIAVRALEILSSRPGFNDLGITVLGGGPTVSRSPLATMRNVRVSPKQPGPTERAAASFDHGVLLSPSRWNTQDLVLAEAMAQGMVAITHPVGGTPEYVDESCALLPRPGDPWAFADALWALVEDPAAVPDLSRGAVTRVASQCGWESTIARDVALIRGLAG